MKISKEHFLNGLIVSTVFWYLLLCVMHYFNQRALWNDEQAVFQSIAAFRPVDFFTQPMYLLQVFPRLYLFLIRCFAEPFDFSMLSLRFLPFVSMMGAFYVWMKVIRFEIRDKFNLWNYILSWAGSVFLIYYCAELKQYSLDTLLGSLYLLFFYKQEELRRKDPRLYFSLAVILPLSGLLSYPALIFAVLHLFNLGRDLKGNAKVFFSSLFVFFAVLVLSYLFDMRLRNIKVVTEGFGDYFISFSSIGEFFKTFGEGMMNLFGRWFAERPRIIKKVAVLFAVLGILRLFYASFSAFRKEGFVFRSIQSTAFGLFLGLLALGILKKYPFIVPRTAMFYCPFVLFLILQGINDLQKIHPLLRWVVQAMYVIFLTVISIALSIQIFSGDLGSMPKLW